MFPKVGIVFPVSAVVPEKVTELVVKDDGALLTKSPLMSILLLPAIKFPLCNVKIPFTVIAEFKVTAPPPCMVKLFNRLVEAGNSAPVPPEAKAEALI